MKWTIHELDIVRLLMVVISTNEDVLEYDQFKENCEISVGGYIMSLNLCLNKTGLRVFGAAFAF